QVATTPRKKLRWDATCEIVDGVFLAFAYPGDQESAIRRVDEAVTIISRNFTGAVSILTHAATYFEDRQNGFIIALTSTAADRGLRSNYVFGASKAGLSTYLEGLRARLHRQGIRVITVKPAAEDAALGLGIDPEFAASFQSSPEEIGERVVEALDHSTDVLYVPWFWRPVMSAVRLIPQGVLKRLPF
ncbi:MAG: SDR family NAD(P)-dependent oxidoreductase, partial [Myxococcota bacterium]